MKMSDLIGSERTISSSEAGSVQTRNGDIVLLSCGCYTFVDKETDQFYAAGDGIIVWDTEREAQEGLDAHKSVMRAFAKDRARSLSKKIREGWEHPSPQP